MKTGTHHILPVCLLLCGAALGGCSRTPEFSADRITEDVRVLAADDFRGRAPATSGEQKTVAYLIERLEAAGVQPGGDPRPDGGRAWTQDVPLLLTRIVGPVKVQVKAGRQVIPLAQDDQVSIRPALTGTEHVALEDVPLVFVGYGVNAPEREWDDFKGIDLKGKVALFLVNDPDFETGEGDFGGKAMTYYGRWTYKFEEAARRGAAGALVIHETEPASYPWAVVGRSGAEPAFDVLREIPLEQHTPLQGWIQRDVAVDLFRRARLDFNALKERSRTRGFQPVVLPGLKFSADFAVHKEQVVSKNVVGVLPGRRHPDEWILYTAHWDHLGMIPGGGADTIYNGAVDNAAGTAQVLEIARGFAQTRRTRRSVAFVFVTAEEKGLLGSEYYAANPLYPLAKTVANLNTDAPRPTAPAKDFTTAGDGAVTLQDILVETGAKFGRHYTPDPAPEAGFFYRSDHFSLAKRGVPAISYKGGEELVEGGIEAGRAFTENYTARIYHQPSDEIGPDWRSDGIARDAALLYALGRRLADSREWPQWRPESEFKAIRDATAAERK